VLDAFAVYARRVCRSHPELGPGSLFFLYAFSKSPSLAVAVPGVVREDQNLFLFGKFDSSRTLASIVTNSDI